MRRTSLILSALVLMSLLALLYQYGSTLTPLSQSSTISTQTVQVGQVNTATAITATQRSAISVSGSTGTFSGILIYVDENPACAKLKPPCKIPSVELPSLVVPSGLRYRLILAPFPDIVNGTQVTLTGVLVTPSSWNGTGELPELHFAGDIFVQTISQS